MECCVPSTDHKRTTANQRLLVSQKWQVVIVSNFALCSLDRLCGMVDVYNYIIRVVNILTFIYLVVSNYTTK